MKTQPVQFQLSPGISHQMIWPYTEREWCVPHDALLFLSVLLRSSAPSSRSPPPLQIIIIFHLSAQTQVHTVQHKRNASKRLTPSRAKLTCQTHIWWWSSLCLPRRCISHLEWWRDMWQVVCVLSTTWSLLGLELWARRDVTVMSQTESNSGESRCTAANENNTHFFGYQSLQFAFLFQLRRMKKNKCLWDNRLL